MVREIILIGSGDLALEVVTYLWELRDVRPFRIVGMVDETGLFKRNLEHLLGYAPTRYTDIPRTTSQDLSFLICVGDPTLRFRFWKMIQPVPRAPFTLIHPASYVAGSATIGDGCIIAPNCFIGPLAQLAENTVINANAVIGHDASIENSAVISPCAAIGGWARIGRSSLVGSGAVIHPKGQLGCNAKLTAGSVLEGHAGDGFLMHGNPARGRQMFRIDR